MAEVEELLDGVAVRLPAAEEIRAKGQRRRNRRRVAGAGGMAVLVAAGVWAVLPWDAPEPEHATVATATTNPFRTDGVIEMKPADELPGYEQWHWKAAEGLATDPEPQDGPLPQIGLGEACPASFVMADEPDQKRYGRPYRGRNDALALHRVVEYDDTATAREELTGLRRSLKACGLRPAQPTRTEADEGSSVWSGTVNEGRTMRVTIQQWNSWVSVVEVLEGRPAG
ncbi:hypothetical protein OG782_14250 [Streptomyces sp. NBC_00876]|uniref:hypothetical protein n=1 Tax=Streptomyces sp. NBC_00876 TaxID=2975853 RepID=UPI00386CC3C7|nr:hypothetical protein OG782_14250 [Streptomyces sp. NBC_00876]